MFTNKKDLEREKKFLKLKQLDRIEYLLEIKFIKEHFSSLFFLMFNFIFVVNITLLLLATMFLIAFKSGNLIQILPMVFYISIWILVALIFSDIINYISKRKAIFKLRERFNLN